MSNEDVLFAESNLFGVFDGATSLGDELFADGLTVACWRREQPLNRSRAATCR